MTCYGRKMKQLSPLTALTIPEKIALDVCFCGYGADITNATAT